MAKDSKSKNKNNSENSLTKEDKKKAKSMSKEEKKKSKILAKEEKRRSKEEKEKSKKLAKEEKKKKNSDKDIKKNKSKSSKDQGKNAQQLEKKASKITKTSDNRSMNGKIPIPKRGESFQFIPSRFEMPRGQKGYVFPVTPGPARYPITRINYPITKARRQVDLTKKMISGPSPPAYTMGIRHSDIREFYNKIQ